MTPIQVIRNESVLPDDIILLRGEANYTFLYFRCGRRLLVSKTLKQVEAQFMPHGFVRINKSSVVNGSFLLDISPNYQWVTLRNDLELTVSRRRREGLRTFLADQLPLG
jgi:DNA-binding LytR/AlgR family response regulator